MVAKWLHWSMFSCRTLYLPHTVRGRECSCCCTRMSEESLWTCCDACALASWDTAADMSTPLNGQPHILIFLYQTSNFLCTIKLYLFTLYLARSVLRTCVASVWFGAEQHPSRCSPTQLKHGFPQISRPVSACSNLHLFPGAFLCSL